MAAPAVQSTSTNTNTGSSVTSIDLTITKPSGLAAGDLMIAIIGTRNSTFDDTTINTPAGWEEMGSTDNNLVDHKTFKKLADASDVAASNFTFSADFAGSNSPSIAGVILRIDIPTTPPPIKSVFVDSAEVEGSTGLTFTGSLLPQVNESLLVMGLIFQEGQAVALSDYVVDAASLTWTERAALTSINNLSVFCATAEMTTAADISSFGATVDETGNVNTQAVLLSVAPLGVTITETPSSVALSGETPAPTINAKVRTTPESATLLSNTPEAKGNIDEIRWTDQEQGSGEWTNKTL